jgi:hypothetical protein
LTVTFTAQAPCGTTNPAWPVVAKSGSNLTGSSFTVNTLSTPLSGTCSAAFVAGPADAAFNGNPKSENITSVAYTPDGAAMQVQVKDAAGATRDGVSIKLELRCTPPDSSCGPGGALLSGPVTATSDSGGIATFTGSIENPINPISIDAIGLNYLLEPTGSGVAGTLSAEFGIYEEGKQCPGASCEVHGNSDDGRISATVSADIPSGSLSVLVSELGLDCTGSIPPGSDYVYRPLSASVVAWLYTGEGSQTITVLVDKALLRFTDRGSAHLDFCLLVEGTIPGIVPPTPKSFVDKFGVTRTEASGPGLLPDCSPIITTNCIVSQTAAAGGDRLVTVTVEDGRGKI